MTDKFPEKKRYDKEYYENNKRQHYLNCTARNKYYREKLEAFLGTRCYLCKNLTQIRKHNQLEFHEIYGNNHATNLVYVWNHHENFIPLCHGCHMILHYLIRHNINLQLLNEIKMKVVVK